MISYAPLWKTMAEKNVTAYTLRVKHGLYRETIQRLRKNKPVSTPTLDKLCSILNCRIEDIVEYVPDEE